MYLLDEDDIVAKEQMKIEALSRMEVHKLLGSCILQFKISDKVMCSDNGIIRDLTSDEIKIIEEYEKKSGCLVYHLIHSIANIGETYELLRVSNYSDDWEYENRYLNKGILLVHSINITHPDWSESGSIEVGNYYGTLFRIG